MKIEECRAYEDITKRNRSFVIPRIVRRKILIGEK